MRPNKPAAGSPDVSPEGHHQAAASDGDVVEVLFVHGATQIVRKVPIGRTSTAAEVVEASGLLREVSALAGAAWGLACFGRRIQPATRLSAGDRVEILLPLKMSPKEARRLLAAGGSGKKRG
jgi:putative ubiquitin-RnfH superfamily antitoxin RatB of RatAB toxin-antitoxin module